MKISIDLNSSVAVLVDPSDSLPTSSYVEVFTKEESLNGTQDWRLHRIDLDNLDAFEVLRDRAKTEEVWIRCGTECKEVVGRIKAVHVDHENSKVVIDVTGPIHHQFVDCPMEIRHGFQAYDQWIVCRGAYRSIEDLCGDVSVIIPDEALCSSTKYTDGKWRVTKGSQREQLVTWREYQDIRDSTEAA